MYKPFNFKPLIVCLKRVSCIVLLASFLFSCSFNPPYQGKGRADIQGIWQQDSVSNSKQLVSYVLYNFRFSCDSVFIRMENFSKVNTGTDTCMSKGHWFEYAGATYETKNGDLLHIKGFYCDAKYRLKDPGGCFNSGVYEDSFKISRLTDSVLVLQPQSSTLPVKLKLVKKLSCVPKPL